MAQAREQSRQGLAHFKAERWVEARSHFREALAARELSSLHYYLGVCEAKLGHDLLAAQGHLERALAMAASADDSPESSVTRRTVVEGARAGLRDLDARLPRAVLRWGDAGPPPGSTLSVDGAEALGGDEVLKGPLRLNPGEHRLVATAPGRRPFATTVSLSEGQTSEVPLRLEFEARPTARPRVALAAVAPAPSGWQRSVGYVGLGLGAALVGAGVFSSLQVASSNDRFASDGRYLAYRDGFAAQRRDVCELAAQGQSAGNPEAATPAQVRGACDERARFATLQYVFYGAGLLTAGAGAYFAFFAPAAPGTTPDKPARRSWHFAPALDRGAARVSLAGAF